MDRTVRLSDVARAAGVSIATASKALNGRSDISERTRDKVTEAAKKLGFYPNSLAQGLLAGRTSTVGILTNDLVGRWALPILVGAEDAFGAGEMSVLLCDAREDAIREQHSLRTLMQRRVDGIIVVGSRTEPRPSLGRGLGVPVVYAYAPSDDPADMSIAPDNISGAKLVINHLVSMGRRRIAIIGGDPGFLAARDRMVGATEALAENGLAAVNKTDLYGDWTEAWGAAATHVLLNEEEPIDAIMCHSDQIARGSLTALSQRGVRVPQQIAVTGFDNWDIMVTGANPQLTSVDMDIQGLGRRAANLLFESLSAPSEAGVEYTPCKIVVRQSSVTCAPIPQPQPTGLSVVEYERQ